MIKVAATGDARTQVMQLVDVYRARIVDVSPESLVIETTGTEDKIDSLLEVLRPYGVIEMVRTGRVEMARGISTPTPIAAQGAAASRGDGLDQDGVGRLFGTRMRCAEPRACRVSASRTHEARAGL